MLLLSVTFAQSAAQPKIWNGQEELGFPSVVSLGVVSEDGQGFSGCTGNLITPRVVLTAGHCGDGYPIELVVEYGMAIFGPSLAEHTATVGFEALIIHPDYVPLAYPLLGENDVSVLILEEDAPEAPTPLVAWELSSDEVVDSDIVSVGFGQTEKGDSGVKKSAEMTADRLTGMFVISDSDTNTDGSNICSGDSGGPQFHLDGERWVQWAVHSWGDTECTQQSGSTRVDVTYEWILDQVEEVHGTRDLCDINGWYDDGICDEDLCIDEDPDCIEEEEDPSPTNEEPPGRGCTHAPGAALLSGFFLLLGRRRR